MTWTVGQRTFHFGRKPDASWPVVAGVLAALLVAGTVVALARAGIGDSSDDKASTASSPGEVRSPIGTGNGTAASGSADLSSGGSAAAAGPSEPSVPALQPKIVRTADLRLRVHGSFEAAMERATSVATLFGGFVTSSSTSSLERGSSSAELTLRVPADQYDKAVGELTKLGKLESEQTNGRDVGGQLVDLDARLRAARAEESALTALLGKAGDVGQVLQVRDRLAAVRTEIEQLDGEQSALRDQVAMSTIHVSLSESGAAATKHATNGHDRDATSIGDSARTAWHAAEAVIGGVLITLGALAPLLVLALLGWMIWAVAARRRHPAVVTEHTFD